MGRKRVRIDSKRQADKRAKRYIGDDDRISRLPDDILVDILSLLSPEEAVRTSVLSSRWMNLWEQTQCLNLDGDSALDKIPKKHKLRGKLIKSAGRKYVSWVNRVLRSHKAVTLKEFRIRFILDRKAKKSITQWLEFAFARHVQRLELDLRDYGDSSTNYCFPEELLARSSGGAPSLEPPSDSLCIHHPRMLLDFKCLRALLFTSVNVTDRAIEFFLHNCPLLEQLVVLLSTKMSNLEVCGSSLMLKHLEIVYCSGLKSLKVSAPSLTYLHVTELEGLFLENVPMLVEIYVNCRGDDISLRHLFSTLSSCVSQLEILRLVLVGGKDKNEICKLPELPKLKKLFIEYLPIIVECLIRLAGLIRASPCLEEFVLKNEWRRLSLKNWEVKDTIKSPHHHLKVVNFSGYYGLTSDLQFVSYILENCVVLKKLIIDPSGARSVSENRLDVEQTARKNAKQQLEAQVPKQVELVIL